MYNLTVEGAHTFFVGEGQWLVHNCDDLINPSTVRFTQDSIKGAFSDSKGIEDLIQGLKSGRIDPGSIPPVSVFERNGVLYSLDNRRLYAFQ